MPDESPAFSSSKPNTTFLLSLARTFNWNVLYFYFEFFFFLLFTTVLSEWDFSHGKFGLLSPGKASCDRVALPNLPCMLGVLVFLN